MRVPVFGLTDGGRQLVSWAARLDFRDARGRAAWLVLELQLEHKIVARDSEHLDDLGVSHE